MAVSVFENLNRFENGILGKASVCVDGGFASIAASSQEEGTCVFKLDHGFLIPGFADVHVHLREPGFSYKETIRSGSLSAARGGYTAVCAMPNLDPVPDSAEHLKVQTDIIAGDAAVHVYPYGAITLGEKGQELAALEELADHVVAFSDDGKGVQSEEMMREAMRRAKALGKIIAAHCEDESLLHGGKIHDGEYARAHGIPGICSESEWGPIARDLKLVEETGCAYHVCHVSTKESVELIRQAKAKGLDVSCEVGPHYLVFDDSMLRDEGGFRMNPPIRAKEDREALIRGLQDGTIDMIATDHAPHSAEEKAGGLRDSLNGIVGLETAFPVLYTHLVKTGVLSLEKLIHLMAYAPRERFGLPLGEGDFTIFDLGREYEIEPEEFLSQGRSTPFGGMKVFGRCLLTAVNGKLVWEEKMN